MKMSLLVRIKYFLLAIGLSSLSMSAMAQNSLSAGEDSLKIIGRKMVLDTNATVRFDNVGHFVKLLVKTLEAPNSFYYPFDSLNMISRLYAPDSSFRIFTWQVEKDEAYVRQFGAIQMHTADGTLRLIPLFDVSEFSIHPTDSVRGPQNWIGAIYYKIILQQFQGKKYYTLLGFDDNSYLTTKKWIEVLTFGKNGEPVFGGDYFEYAEDPNKPKPPVKRFAFEFKKDAKARLNYDEDRHLIIFDHLISEENKPWEKMTLVPDGDYEGFKWQNGRWIHIDKIFNQKLNEGEVPMPNPVNDRE